MSYQNNNDVQQTDMSDTSHQSGSGVGKTLTKKQEYLKRMHELNNLIVQGPKNDPLTKWENPISLPWSVAELIDKLKIQTPYKLIDLDPPYQRKDVWPDKKRKEFLNNLFLGCPINDIILVLYKRDDKGNKFYRVMDGKQRITCILRYTQDQSIKIDLDEAEVFDWHKKSYQDLISNLDTMEIFNKTKIQVKVYDTTHLNEQDSLDWESWTFTEMNSPMALNNIERRNAHNNELNDILKEIYTGMEVWDRIYTKSISENDRFKNKEIIEKVFYQNMTGDWFSNKTTDGVMIRFQESDHDSFALNRVKDNFRMIHNIIRTNENHKKNYWNIKTDKKGRTTYKKTNFCSPINNLDLLTYGMYLLDVNTNKTEVKESFDRLVSIFYHYMGLYKTNQFDKFKSNDLDLLKQFIVDSSKATNSTGPKRKEYLDHLYSIIK